MEYIKPHPGEQSTKFSHLTTWSSYSFRQKPPRLPSVSFLATFLSFCNSLLARVLVWRDGNILQVLPQPGRKQTPYAAPPNWGHAHTTSFEDSHRNCLGGKCLFPPQRWVKLRFQRSLWPLCNGTSRFQWCLRLCWFDCLGTYLKVIQPPKYTN